MVRVMVMVPGLTLRFRLRFVPWLLPVPMPVAAAATVLLKLPKVPSLLAPKELLFQSSQLPLVAEPERVAVVSEARWVAAELEGAEELENESQPAMSVAAEADMADATRVADTAMEKFFMLRQ